MLRQARRIVIAVVGTTVLLIGAAMLVLPGPAIVVIPVGLAILATEFAWARRWLNIVRDSAEKGATRIGLGAPFRRRAKDSAEPPEGPCRSPRAGP